MGRYLALWKADQTKIPIDPKERGPAWGAAIAMVEQDIEKGLITSWGGFVGEANGYAVMEGTEVEVMKSIQQWIPYFIFEVHPLASESQVKEMIKALSG